MSGDWLKMEHALPDKPEVLAISSAIGIEPDAVVGKCFRVWRWFDQHTKGGHAVGVTSVTLLSVIGHGHNNAAFIEHMKMVGWLFEDETGLTVPNFYRHNGETAKARGLAGKRKQKQRSKCRDDVTDKSRYKCDKSVTREEKRREDIKTMSGKPDALEVLTYLNQRAKRDYRAVDSNLRLIAARLGEGAVVAECKAVIDVKVKEWADDPKWSKYLRPETLFNATKFASYVGEVGATKQDGKDWE